MDKYQIHNTKHHNYQHNCEVLASDLCLELLLFQKVIKQTHFIEQFLKLVIFFFLFFFSVLPHLFLFYNVFFI